MLMRQFAFRHILLTGTLVSLTAHTAHAGPLIDWLFHKPAYAPAVPVGAPYPVTAGYAPAMPYGAGYSPYSTGYTPYTPYTSGYSPYSTGYAPAVAAPYTPYTTGYSGYSNYSGYTPYGVAYPSTGYRPSTGNMPTQSSYALPSYGTYYGSTSPVVGANGYGYLTQRPPNNVIATTPAVMPTNPVTLVPDYRSTYARTPVTYYRPVLTTDPNTGSQVVALAPCSSYEYQTQRVPTWGLTQVYNGGATLPVAPTAPVVLPNYGLPRGGVPLAGPVPGTQPYATAYAPAMSTSTITPVAPTTGSIITPASPTPYTSGYSGYASNYGNYSALQPGPLLPPSGNYPTTPYNPYYGNGNSVSGGSTGSGCTGGGSTGSYIAPSTTYGSAPYGTTTSPALISPGLPAPTYTTPGTLSPSFPANPNPNPMPSSDPAAGQTPVLPPLNSNSRIDSKPQLQNIVQQPLPTSRAFNPSSTSNNNGNSSEPKAQSGSNQGLLPIPVPEDFKHEPRWNPGLLKEQDTTASVLRDISPVDPQIAWGSKPIRWASHKTSAGKPVQDALPPAQLRSMPVEKYVPPAIDIPEVNFPAPRPARLELEAAQPEVKPAGKQDPKIDPKGRRTDVWK